MLQAKVVMGGFCPCHLVLTIPSVACIYLLERQRDELCMYVIHCKWLPKTCKSEHVAGNRCFFIIYPMYLKCFQKTFICEEDSLSKNLIIKCIYFFCQRFGSDVYSSVLSVHFSFSCTTVWVQHGVFTFHLRRAFALPIFFHGVVARSWGFLKPKKYRVVCCLNKTLQLDFYFPITICDCDRKK